MHVVRGLPEQSTCMSTGLGPNSKASQWAALEQPQNSQWISMDQSYCNGFLGKKKTPKTWNTLICAIITCCLLPNGFFFSSPDARCGQDTSSSRSLRMLSCTTRSSRVRRVTSRDRHRGPKGRGNHRFGEKTEKKLTP